MAWLEKRDGKYKICYRDEIGKTRRVNAYTDKSASKQMMTELERAIAHGERGLINPFKKHRSRPLMEHVADWIVTLQERGKDDMYIAPCRARLQRLATDCGWTTLDSINADSLEHWRQTAKSDVAHNRKDKEHATVVSISARTKNHYLETLRAFCNWCVKRKRMAANPVAHLEKVDQSQDIRRERRALGEDEVVRLLAAVPEEHQLLYRVALCTGLRRNELGQLQWGDIRLDGNTPFIQLRAKTTKARRADCLPIRADLAQALRDARGGAGDVMRVFAQIPRIKWHKRWLAKAGIPYLDADGRRADLHALRHTYGTLLSKAGVSPREAMELMRHSDLRQTMKVYTDPRIFNLSAAIEKLPVVQIDFSEFRKSNGGGGNNVRHGDAAVANRVANIAVERQSVARIGKSRGTEDSPEVMVKKTDRQETAANGREEKRAGDGVRTHDVQLGKLAFYH
jgi:integrase